MSNAVYCFFKSFNIQNSIAAAYHLQSNDKAEKVIKTIKIMMTRMTNDTKLDWTRLLQLACGAYKFVLHKSTGFSPLVLLYGKEALFLEEMLKSANKKTINYEEKLALHIKKNSTKSESNRE